MAAVFIVRDGVVKLAKVHVGRDNAEQIEVLEGLSPEDDVAVTHGTELAEGMHVKHRARQREAYSKAQGPAR